MSNTGALLLAAGIGALAGLGGGGLAALAVVRASQVTARVMLAPKLHAIAREIISLHGAVATRTADEAEARGKVSLAWNDFAVHQRILCPSPALELLANLILKTTKEKGDVAKLLTLAGQAQALSAEILAVYSEHLFRSWARHKEKEIIADWLAGDASGLASDAIRTQIAEGLGLSKHQRKRIKPAETS